jgi:hypothetical protein
MARLFIVAPADDFHTLFDDVLAQAGYIAVEAANSYEGRPTANMVCRADGPRALPAPALRRLLLVEPAAQFLAFFRDVLAQAGYVALEAVPSEAGRAAANAAGRAGGRWDIRYLVIF